MRKTTEQIDRELAEVDSEILPVSDRERKGLGRFAGLYAAEHVAGTEFVFGATFVILGVGLKDILIGLIIGNTLAILSFWLITTPIARKARVSLYTYLGKIGGSAVSRLYNLANAIIFVTIAAAMITVSVTAVRHLVGIPAQSEAYPTNIGFVVLVIVFGALAVLVAAFGFNAVSKIAIVCGPWLMVMFAVGGMVLLPGVAESVTGFTTINSWSDFASIAESTVFTGQTPDGEPGIGMIEVAAFAWAANTFSHFGLIDMALLRYAKKNWHGIGTATGMMFGHYVAWISAGFMGAATAAVTLNSITVLEPGEVAWYALSWTGFLVVIIGGWTTANPNLYRAGLAAQGVFPQISRSKVTIVMGIILVVVACFPFVYRNYAPLVSYAGAALVPVGGIIFAEHYLFQRLGMTKFWARFKEVRNNAAIFAWAISLAVVAVLVLLGVPYYFIFIPVWFVSIIVYTLLARWAGATEQFPDKETAEELYNERAQLLRDRQVKEREAIEAPDTTLLSRILLGICIIILVVIFVYAWIVLFHSPDMYAYLTQRQTFYTIALIGTSVYFIAGFWALWRSQNYRGTRKLTKKERTGKVTDSSGSDANTYNGTEHTRAQESNG
ncbi:purine-cytosine permease family protein [Corynebacterium glyciniphilum]|uniref:purine-cytosine permease family protein n=1 Tax=Corynebacterium glyciniphilum TaxID=1404244 RepID=UPI003DA0E5A5